MSRALRALVASCAGALLLAACGSFPGVCTRNLVLALSVRVTDARTDAGICDAGVVVSEGTFSEQLEAEDPNPATCVYVGVAERSGTYRIVVQHPDYMTATVDDVVVSKNANGCHVMPETRTVALQPP